jgi:alpha-L-fucosidase
MAIERWLPSSAGGYRPWHKISHGGLLTGGAASSIKYVADEPSEYYIPGEVCDPIGREWFAAEDDVPRSDAELLGMRLISRERNTNFLLNVPPNKHGLIRKDYINSLMTLQRNLDLLHHECPVITTTTAVGYVLMIPKV